MAFPSILGSHLLSHRGTQWEQLLRWISDGWMFPVMYFTLFCVNLKLFQTTWQGSSPPPVRGTVPEGSSRWQHRLLQKGRTPQKKKKKNPSTYMLFLILLRLSRPPTLECKWNMPGHANKENNFSVWRWHIILNIIIIKIAKICNCCAELLQSCPTLCYAVDSNSPGSSVPGILQARTLEWVAMPSSRGSSQPWGWTQVSRISGGFFTTWSTREAQEYWSG